MADVKRAALLCAINRNDINDLSEWVGKSLCIAYDIKNTDNAKELHCTSTPKIHCSIFDRDCN